MQTLLKKFFTRQLLRKVPEVTAYFWIIKLLTTAMGESTSDTLVHAMSPIFAVTIGFIGFLVAISLQLQACKYNPWIYWLTATMVAIFGTMAADVVHIVLGIPYVVSTISFAIGLSVIFVIWYKTEKTLSIHSIFTSRRELFYWLTVIATFALGTALGDTSAITFHLGYLASGVLFAILFALPLFTHKVFHANEVITFWAAYIMTRPFGASFADWLGRSADAGSVGFGTGRTSLVLTLLIIMLVGYVAVVQKNSKPQSSGSSMILI